MNAIILAGGLSRRMNGTRKAFLRLGDETFLERILRVLGPLVDSFLIVTNEPDLYSGFDARLVRDEREGVGPLMGIYSGLNASESEMNFVTAVDTPLLDAALVRRLAKAGDGCDVRLPAWHGETQPLCAVYSRRCLPAIRRVLDQERAGEDTSPGANPGAGTSANPGTGPRGRIITFFPLVRVCIVEEPAVRKLDPEGLSFFNVNTREDYESLRSLATDGGP